MITKRRVVDLYVKLHVNRCLPLRGALPRTGRVIVDGAHPAAGVNFLVAQMGRKQDS